MDNDPVQKQHQITIENWAQSHKIGLFFHPDFRLSDCHSICYIFSGREKTNSKDVKICETNPIRRTNNRPKRLHRIATDL
jgi:hypothetical protein